MKPVDLAWLMAWVSVLSFAPGVACAQLATYPIDDCWRQPVLDFTAPTQFEPASIRTTGISRVRMFGMPPGFLRSPLGLDVDDFSVPIDDVQDKRADDFGGVVLSLGAYNPFFDIRRPDEPRGPGYYQVHSQVQLLDFGPSNISVVLQAVTPVGLDGGGNADGLTILCPAFAWCHDFGGGTALQGYFGQSIHCNAAWNESLGTRFHYGLGIQTPVPEFSTDGTDGLFFFIQAMGRYRYETLPENRPAVWDIYPGLQWRVSENCWMSIGASRRNLFTWCWEY
jgi:hypothetical protein